MGAFGRELQRHFGGTIHDVSTWGTSKKEINLKTEEKMSNNKEEFVSLYDFLGKPAGSEVGKQVYAAAKKAGEKVENTDVSNKKFTGKVLTYRRGFLDIYFAALAQK